nr:DUF1294 domain-containing protein [uncultured Roseateles sp.]
MNRPSVSRNVKNVEIVRPAPTRKLYRNGKQSQWGPASLFAILALFVVYLLVAVVWRVLNWCAMLYLVASVICFVAYAEDKSAAVAGNWCIAESTVLVLGLVGSWPGSINVQHALRHKSHKASFRLAF